jgi:hypothetical protein
VTGVLLVGPLPQIAAGVGSHFSGRCKLLQGGKKRSKSTQQSDCDKIEYLGV